MKNKPARICPICKQSLSHNDHGNRKVHEECKPKAIYWKNFFGYRKIKDIRNTAILLESILEIHFPHSNGSTPVNKNIFDEEKFKWDFNSRITNTTGNKPIFWIINYGYSYVDIKKKQILIHYDN